MRTFKPLEDVKTCVISGFRHEVDENCALLGHYAASNGNSLPTFRVFEFLTLEEGTRSVVPKRRYEITTTRYVITQKSAVLIKT